MKVLARILRQVNILHVRFLADGGHEMTLVLYTLGKGKPEAGEAKLWPDPAAEKDALLKAPLVATVSGKGVITKDSSVGGIIETVTSSPETFISTAAADGRISFVRKEQLATISNDLENAGITPLYVECLPDGNAESLQEIAGKFYSSNLKWKKVLKPSAEGTLLATLVAKRIQLPVLGFLLVLLMANYLVSAGVQEDFQTAGAELAALRKSASAATSGNERKQAVIEQFSQRLQYRFNTLSDRIAAAVPGEIVLNELSISPVTKNVEAGKPVQQNERVVIIRGETPRSESIASFVESLGNLDYGKVRLSGVENDNDRSVLAFRIEVEL